MIYPYGVRLATLGNARRLRVTTHLPDLGRIRHPIATRTRSKQEITTTYYKVSEVHFELNN